MFDYIVEEKMVNLSRVRRLAFLAILVGALMPSASVRAFDPICPNQYCDYCPANWYGSCYVDPGDSCSEYGCGGSYGPCTEESTGDTKDVCVCAPCMD